MSLKNTFTKTSCQAISSAGKKELVQGNQIAPSCNTTSHHNWPIFRIQVASTSCSPKRHLPAAGPLAKSSSWLPLLGFWWLIQGHDMKCLFSVQSLIRCFQDVAPSLITHCRQRPTAKCILAPSAQQHKPRFGRRLKTTHTLEFSHDT